MGGKYSLISTWFKPEKISSSKQLLVVFVLGWIFLLMWFWDSGTLNEFTRRSPHEKVSLINSAELDLNATEHEIVETLYNAAKIVRNEYGIQSLDEIIHHQSILRTRVFPEKPRPLKCDKCNVYNFKRLLSPRNVCSGSEEIDLLILITTVPSAMKEREMIRSTWATYTKKNTGRARYIFLYGAGWSIENQKIIDKEHQEFGDLIQDDFKDAYYNLSYKVVMGYRWALKDCPRAQYIMRSAHDNFIFIPSVLTYLKEDKKNSNQRKQIGTLNPSFHVDRRRRYKWYISPNEYKANYFPKYNKGTAFIFSRETVHEVLIEGENVPFFSIEDAWFGFIMDNLKIQVLTVPGFGIEFDGSHLKHLNSGSCPFRKPYYNVHLVTPDVMQKIWKICL